MTVEATELIAKLDRLGPSADYVTREVGRETAKLIVAEAKRRVARASGDTQTGIHWEMTRDGKGYVVLAYEAGKQPPVDWYLEQGTKFLRARPFFMSSALLEEGPHMRRLEEAVQKFLDDVGR